MARVINVWSIEISVGDEFIRGVIHESQTDDVRGLRSRFILYTDRFKSYRPPLGSSFKWHDSLKAAKQAFKRKYGRHIRLNWIKQKEENQDE